MSITKSSDANTPDAGESWGRKLREIRTGSGLTQKELAKRAEIDVTYLSKVEHGALIPKVSTIRRLGAALGLPDQEIATLILRAGRATREDSVRRTSAETHASTPDQSIERILSIYLRDVATQAREGAMQGRAALEEKLDHQATMMAMLLTAAKNMEQYFREVLPPLRQLLSRPLAVSDHRSPILLQGPTKALEGSLEAEIKNVTEAAASTEGATSANNITVALKHIATALDRPDGEIDGLLSSLNVRIIVADDSDEFFGRLALGASRELQKSHRCTISTHNTNEQFINEWDVIYQARKDPNSGFIIVPAIRPYRASVIHHKNSMDKLLKGAKVVFVDRPAPEGLEQFPSALVDNIGEAERAVEHLITVHGYKKITAVAFSATARTDRTVGYKAAMKKHGLANNIHVLNVTPDSSILLEVTYGDRAYGDVIAAVAKYRTLQLLEGNPEDWPQAIFATNNRASEGVLQALREKQVTIGKGGIAFISFDLPHYWQGILDLTAVVQDPEEMGRTAASLLIEWVDSGRKPESISNIPTSWIKGASCGCQGVSLPK